LEDGDWPGNPLKTHVQNEGRCKEPVKRIHKERDENGREKAEYHLGSLRHKYYIPFSKKTVDGILEKTGTDKNRVIYYGRFTGGPNAKIPILGLTVSPMSNLKIQHGKISMN
jgi:hypothetical protein